MSLITEVDHVCIAVHDLEAATSYYCRMFEVEVADRQQHEGAEMVMFAVAGSYIQLMSPTTEDSPVAKFLSRNGEGVYKIGFRVADCAATVDHIRSVGGRLLGEAPQRVGSAQVDSFAFLHPKESLGTLIELVQRTERHGSAG